MCMTERVIISHFGIDSQIDKAIEEMSELTEELMLYKYNYPDTNSLNLIDEIADVKIMINQLSAFFGEEQVKERVVYKLARTIDRISKGYYNKGEE